MFFTNESILKCTYPKLKMYIGYYLIEFNISDKSIIGHTCHDFGNITSERIRVLNYGARINLVRFSYKQFDGNHSVHSDGDCVYMNQSRD